MQIEVGKGEWGNKNIKMQICKSLMWKTYMSECAIYGALMSCLHQA